MFAAIGVVAFAGIVGKAQFFEVLDQQVISCVVVRQVVDGGPANVKLVVLGAIGPKLRGNYSNLY